MFDPLSKEKKVEFIEKLLNCLSLKETKGDLLVVVYGKEDDKAIPLCSKSSLDEIQKFNCTGNLSEMFLVGNKIYISIGDVNDKDIDGASLVPVNTYKAMATLSKVIKANFKEYSVSFCGETVTGSSEKGPVLHSSYSLSDCYFGLIQSLYKFNPKFYTDADDNSFFPELKLVYNEEKHSGIIKIAKAQCIARYLGDMPSNWMTPSIFVSHAKALFKNHLDVVTIKSLDQEQCKELGMNVYYSVAQGSNEPGQFLAMEYKGKKDSDKHHVALVGKGVTFDTGGISLKPPKAMKDMKMDMLGGASMLATFYLAVALPIPMNISCTIPLVENMPGGKATKPGDVFVAKNGKTVEVDNTDAEGRLILADAICYAQTEYSSMPLYLMDAATLTGAIIVALGNMHGGYFTNDLEFSKVIDEASSTTNEFLVKMPLSKTYFDLMKSDVSDMLNTGLGYAGGANTAAIFLYQFVAKSVKYVHFDICGIGMEGLPKEVYGSDSSGRPVKAFYEILSLLSKKFN